MNKINIALSLIAAVLLLAVLNGQTRQPPSNGQAGRFQLFSGETFQLGIAGSVDKVILRIDTQNGNVDQWMQGTKNGSPIDMWVRTGDLRPQPTAK